MPFDGEKWKAGKARHRVAMAHYLVDEKLLEGKTRAELFDMLGHPDVDKPGSDGTRWLLGYYAKGLFDESIWLELTIKDDGTASSAGVGMSWEDPRER